jgi:uncharacterized membrane protein YagU involved in acid resistance
MTYADTRTMTTGWWIKHGIIGGIIGGIAMMMVEMIIAALMGMDAFMPPRMIAGIVLGPSAMQPATPLMTALGVTMVVHLMLSIIYGLIFAWLVSRIAGVRSTAAVIVSASFYGLLLWLINFYVIAPPAGWVWFPTMANPVQQFIAHVFGFGTVLGIYLDRVLEGRRETFVEHVGAVA